MKEYEHPKDGETRYVITIDSNKAMLEEIEKLRNKSDLTLVELFRNAMALFNVCLDLQLEGRLEINGEKVDLYNIRKK